MLSIKKLLAPIFCAALLLTMTSCGDDTQDSAGETLDNAREDLGDAVDDAIDGAGDVMDDAAVAAAELAARNLASAQGADEFSANGIDVDGDLTCEADATDDRSAVEVSCTGTGTEGQELEVEGTTSEMPGASITELEGDFTGTADGDEVFSVQSLGG